MGYKGHYNAYMKPTIVQCVSLTIRLVGYYICNNHRRHISHNLSSWHCSLSHWSLFSFFSFVYFYYIQVYRSSLLDIYIFNTKCCRRRRNKKNHLHIILCLSIVNFVSYYYYKEQTKPNKDLAELLITSELSVDDDILLLKGFYVISPISKRFCRIQSIEICWSGGKEYKNPVNIEARDIFKYKTDVL